MFAFAVSGVAILGQPNYLRTPIRYPNLLSIQTRLPQVLTSRSGLETIEQYYSFNAHEYSNALLKLV